jgi:tetratricopeptide (TPR) repeat protein
VIVGKHGETLVVDWGLAKATGARDPGASEERALVPSSASGSAETLPGAALGTPAYMSPEQARGDLAALGPRSDVYSLGATLYGLLTGRPPFEGDDPGAVLRAVQRGAFPPPRALAPWVDRALEAVCLKAMALKPGDRYATPRTLADDVERWMADEPVAARREPLARRARRWARRHRPAVTGAAAAVLAGVVGLAAVVAVQTRANAKLNQANVNLRDANAATTRALAATGEAKKAAERALDEAEESRRQAQAVGTFLVASFCSPDPSQDRRQVKVADLLDRAAETLDKEFNGTAATKGALLDALGETYRGLGLYDTAVATHTKARAVREAALGPDHPDTLASRNNLAEASRAAGRTAEAIRLHEGTLKLMESALGPDHPNTLTSRNNLANAYRAAGRTTEAIALQEGTLKLREARLGPDHPDTLASRSNLAVAYWKAGRLDRSVPLFEETNRRLRGKLGPDHPDTLVVLANLGVNLRDAGRPAEGARLLMRLAD